MGRGGIRTRAGMGSSGVKIIRAGRPGTPRWYLCLNIIAQTHAEPATLSTIDLY